MIRPMHVIFLSSGIFLLDRGDFSIVQCTVIQVMFTGWIQDCSQIDIAPDNQFGWAYSGAVYVNFAQCFNNTRFLFKPAIQVQIKQVILDRDNLIMLQNLAQWVFLAKFLVIPNRNIKSPFLENIFKSRLNHLSVTDLFKHH